MSKEELIIKLSDDLINLGFKDITSKRNLLKGKRKLKGYLDGYKKSITIYFDYMNVRLFRGGSSTIEEVCTIYNFSIDKIKEVL